VAQPPNRDNLSAFCRKWSQKPPQTRIPCQIPHSFRKNPSALPREAPEAKRPAILNKLAAQLTFFSNCWAQDPRRCPFHRKLWLYLISYKKGRDGFSRAVPAARIKGRRPGILHFSSVRSSSSEPKSHGSSTGNNHETLKLLLSDLFGRSDA
jgi:hypothetical protein